MRVTMAGLGALAMTALSTVAAADGPVVVELFTSQGCSSCPPADAILSDLAERDDVIALALHVDYWDYIGWADSFASPAFTERQQRYAAAANDTTVYTPQFVVGGQEHVIGARAMDLAAAIMSQSAAPTGVTVAATRDGATIRIEATSSEAREMVVQLVRFDSEETVEIPQGENAGLTVSYANVVTGWDTLASWGGQAPLSMDVDLPDGPAAVIVQSEGAGPILAAARVDRP